MSRVPVLLAVLAACACGETPRAAREQPTALNSERVQTTSTSTVAPGSPEVSAGAATSMHAFRAAFDSAANPKPEEVIGEWWLIQTVIAEKGEAEEIDYDPTGTKEPNAHGDRLTWKLLVLRGADGRLFQTSQYSWVAYPISGDVSFTDNGELLFGADFEADSILEYRCRARTRVRLICLMRGAEHYEGREYLKVR